MEQIKAGDFIRTKGGNIGQVLKVIPESKFTTRIGRISHSPEKYWIDTRKGSISKPYIKKYSPNIIDLIEEGDYVNGSKVLEVCLDSPSGSWIDVDCNKQTEECTFWNPDIKNVVTKEQFNQMKFVVGDESNEM